MIECPNCRHKELPGTLFCSECGTQLTGASDFSTLTIQRGLTGQLDEVIKKVPQTAEPPTSITATVSLYIMDSGQILPLESRTEFTLGRSAEGQPILPDIDLAPYRGYEYGVSRLHASITLGGQQILATDLGSANGTRLNGQKIPPHKPYPVNHGDILTLGKLKIQLLVRR
jgi:LysM repeat protein